MGVDMPLNKTKRPKVKIEIKREWEIMQNKSIAQYSKERKGVMYFKEGCLSPWQLTIQREVMLPIFPWEVKQIIIFCPWCDNFSIFKNKVGYMMANKHIPINKSILLLHFTRPQRKERCIIIMLIWIG